MALTASVYFGSSGLAAAPLDMSPPPPPPPSAPTGTGDAAARSITAMMTKSAERRSVSSMASPPLILNRRVESAVPLNSAPDCEDPEGWSMLLRRRRHFIRPRSEDTMADPVTWPDGARCAIMMTFDLDGETPWIHCDPALAERPLHMSMGAYGPKTGMPRILEVLDRYGIKTCIFVPGWIVERYPALCEDIVRRGHEVGHHGYLHEKPFFMKSREEEEELLVKSLQIFKKILGVTPLGARVPSADPDRTSRVSAREALLQEEPRRRGRAAGEEPPDLQEDPGGDAARGARAVRRSEPAFHGSPRPARLRLSQQRARHRSPLLPRHAPRSGRRVPDRLVQQRRAVLPLERGTAGRQRHLEPGRRVGDLVRGVRGSLRGGQLLQLARPSPDHRAPLAHAHGRTAHPAHPRQGPHLVASAGRARPLLARARGGAGARPTTGRLAR